MSEYKGAQRDRTHHHFVGVNADAGFEWMRSLRVSTLPVIAQIRLHLESRIERRRMPGVRDTRHHLRWRPDFASD